MEKILLKSTDGYELDVHLFEVKNAKAIIQLIHGMEEHQERYEDFISFLNDNGYSVLSSDMRGHGISATKTGFFKERKGHEHLLNDQVTILNYIKKRFIDLPIYLFAHSMGTIISRNLIQKEGHNYTKICLSGYPNYQNGAGFGVFFANVIQFFKGPYKKSPFLTNLVTGSFSRKVKSRKSNLDWLTYNEDNVKAYLEDPLCGFGFSVSAYRDLFNLVKGMHKVKRYIDVNPTTPILLISGEDDPCTGGEKGRKDSYKILQKAGYKDIGVITYKMMRHEILNELEKEKVYRDVLDFYNK